MSEYIKKHQKRKEQNRILKRERDALPLDERMDAMINDEHILTKP